MKVEILDPEITKFEDIKIGQHFLWSNGDKRILGIKTDAEVAYSYYSEQLVPMRKSMACNLAKITFIQAQPI